MDSVEFTLEDYDHFREVVGSLMISQFDGDQGQYRSVINTLFAEFANHYDDEHISYMVEPSDGETE